jgi:hypothetical protein
MNHCKRRSCRSRKPAPNCSRDILDTEGGPGWASENPRMIDAGTAGGHRTSDPHLTTGWIGQEPDILIPPQFIEHRPVRVSSASPHGGPDTARAAVEKLAPNESSRLQSPPTRRAARYRGARRPPPCSRARRQ